jgi:hypothetical protein
MGFVGSFVGFFVGFSGLPDKHSALATNDLDAICRICRVSSERESLGGLNYPVSTRDGLE